jgi:hypothetical protein
MDDDDEIDDDIDVMETQEDDSPSVSSTSETNVFSSAFCSFVHGLPGGTTRKSGEKFSYCGSKTSIINE